MAGADQKLSQRNETTDPTDAELHIIKPEGGGLFSSWRITLANLVKTLTDAIAVLTGQITDLSDTTNLTKLNKATGIIYGGELSINVDPTLFNIAAGKAIVVDSFTDPITPTFTEIIWPIQLGLSVDNIATQLVSYVILEANGTFTQQPGGLTVEDARDRVEIGVLVHANLTIINSVANTSNWQLDTDLKILDQSNAIGRMSISGNVFSFNGANVKVNKTGGETFGLNGNYAVNKKNPNIASSPTEAPVLMFRVYGGTPAVVGVSEDVDTINYDPLGAGTLVPIPAGAVTTHGIFFSPETGITAVHYGQFLYDTLREAVDSWEKEEYTIISELDGVPLMGVLAFVQGATDLSDPLQAKFIKPGLFGIKDGVRVPGYSRYASANLALSGMTYRRPVITLEEDLGVIYADVERLGGGDLVFVFGEREYVLDCTTGSGVDGKARVALTAGTATLGAKNWVYVTKVPGDGLAQLNASINRPTGEFAYVFDCLIQDSVSFLANKALESRRHTDAKEFDGRSSMARSNERLRVLPAEWEPPGILQTVTIDTVPAPDSVDISVTAGEVWQKHLQAFPAMSVLVDDIYIVNHPTAPYTKISDLNDTEALQTSDGSALAGTRFNWIIWGVQNMTTGECKLMLNLPNGSYSDDVSAVSDNNRTAVITVPVDFRGTAFLIARMPMRHRTTSGGTYENLALSILGTQVVDLRGILANVTGGATSVPIGSSFEDALFNIYNVLAGFAFKFSAANLTGDRIFTVPNVTGLLAISGMVDAFKFNGQVSGGDYVKTFAAVASFNLNDGNSQEMVISANVTSLALTNKVNGGSYLIYLVQDATGGWTIPVPGASFGNPTSGSVPISTGANHVNIIKVTVRPSGATYYTVETYIP